ncbi:putative RNA recognition motif domain, nucleotide-binding alpha-beta plait domain superfamily [Helianthus annuus]|nr:putative RNA recognition motif domain, nucleotide-binding alpha-beta plait domain superfamily [Helianthus annuus]
MADGYWNTQRQQQQLHSSSSLLKRPRSEYDLPPSGLPFSHDKHNYPPQNDIGRANNVKDTETIGSAYDRYLQSAKLPSGDASGGIAGMHSLPLLDPVGMARGGPMGPDLAAIARAFPFDRHSSLDLMARPPRETLPLPADASSTIYIEGLPSNCTRREVAHIFRPFVGYKEVRLISKESKHRGGDPLIIGFVDFTTPACAATALSALQGYKMDEHDPSSSSLRLQFSKNPGPRSGTARRGGRR